jgi:Mrp family chromosome partitioning ATPase
VADATALAQAVDGVLLVLEAGKTRRQAARNAVESLHQVGTNLVGVVLNAVPTHKGRYYYYSYHHTTRPMGTEGGGESTAGAGCSGEGGRPIDVVRQDRPFVFRLDGVTAAFEKRAC